MVKVIGTNGCGHCNQIKQILTQRNIEFDYCLFNDLNETEQNVYTNMATEAKQMGFPLLIVNDQITTLDNILKENEAN